MGTCSVVFLFSVLFCSLFLFSDYVFFAKINNRRAGARPDILFVLSSIHLFFSLFFFYIVYSTTTGGDVWDAMGPARAAQQHGTGQGAGEREEEVERLG